MKSSLKTTFFNLLKLSNMTFFDDLKLVANMQKKKSGYIKHMLKIFLTNTMKITDFKKGFKNTPAEGLLWL